MPRALRARHVLVGSGADRRWLTDGVVTYDDGVITDVRPGPAPDGVPTVDLGEAVLLPGLIDLDALVDVDHLVLDSWHAPEHARALAGSVDYWSEQSHDVLSPDERDTLREFGVAQLALHGITTFMPIASEVHLGWNESARELHHLAEVTSRLGLRGYLGPSYRSRVAAVDASGERVFVDRPERGAEGLAAAVQFAKDIAAQADPLLEPVLLPCRIETLTEDLMRATADAARDLGVRVRMHALQQRWEREVVLERHGVTPLDLIDRTGLLTDRLLVPHALWLDRHPQLGGRDTGDLARLADAGVSVIHCPLTSFRYGEVLRTLDDYLAAGVTICLGTDSFPPDLIRGMDVGFHAARVLFGHGSATLAQYADAATTGGATALGRPDLGRIEVGAAADLVAFGLDDVRDGVVEDPLRTLVLNATARNVRHSVVAGRDVVVDGTLPDIDLPRLRARAQQVFERLVAGYTERDAAGRGRDELFPPSFPRATGARA